MSILQEYQFGRRRLRIFELPPEAAAEAARGAAPARPPGAGQIHVHSLQAAVVRRAAGARLELSGVVEGGPIASVAAKVLLYDAAQGRAYGPILTQYLAASSYRQAAGVRIPIWETPLRLRLSLPLGLRLISDGRVSSLARLVPLQPGEPGARLALQAAGEYLPADGGAPRRAKAIFGVERRLTEVLVYAPLGGAAQAPRAIQPAPGERFTPHLRMFELGDGTEAEAGVFRPHGPGQAAAADTLTLGEAGLRWYAAPAMPGEYLAGLAVSDLDGEVQRAFARVRLEMRSKSNTGADVSTIS